MFRTASGLFGERVKTDVDPLFPSTDSTSETTPPPTAPLV